MREDFITAVDIEIGYYQAYGYRLSIAQLYYRVMIDTGAVMTLKQFSRKIRNLARNDVFDWQSLVDFDTRDMVKLSHGPRHCLRRAANQYVLDRWRNQPHRVEVITDTCLSGVVETVCKQWAVPATVIKSGADPVINAVIDRACDSTPPAIILYLGDHYDTIRRSCNNGVVVQCVCPNSKQRQSFELGPTRGCAAISPEDVGNVLDKRLNNLIENRESYKALSQQQVRDYNKIRDLADAYARIHVPKEGMRSDSIPDSDLL